MLNKIKFVSEEHEAYSFPTDPDGFIKWINEQVDKAGVSRDKITINVSGGERYGDPYGTLDIEYQRPYTAEEIAEDEARSQRDRQWEIEQLRKLKAKYPDA